MKNNLIMLVIGFAIGIASAVFSDSLLTANKKVEQANSAVKGTAKAVLHANDQEVALSDNLNRVTENSGKVLNAVDNRLNQSFELRSATNADQSSSRKNDKTKSTYVNTCAPAIIDGDSYMPFNIGTVRLLNAARAGASVDSVSVSDAESAAPAYVTIRVFVANDTEIAKMYNELAERHNSLVDQVSAYQKRQKQRLGIKNE